MSQVLRRPTGTKTRHAHVLADRLPLTQMNKRLEVTFEAVFGRLSDKLFPIPNLQARRECAMKKLDSRSRVKKKPAGRKIRDHNAELRHDLEELSEKFDIVMPEVTARVAALEHLLREKELVTRKDLVSARAFVRLQEE
jgi:hypothetical protein